MRLPGVLLLLGLSGCAEQPPAPLKAEAARALEALPAWNLEGRVGVKLSREGWQADVHWRHERTQDRLRLSGPFSQGLVSIVIQDDLIYINEGEGPVLAKEPERYLKERLGFVVPLKSLRYWVLGRPNPALPSQPLSPANGALPGFVQSGWLVRAEDVGLRDGFEIPGRLWVEGPGVRLKILIDQWSPT